MVWPPPFPFGCVGYVAGRLPAAFPTAFYICLTRYDHARLPPTPTPSRTRSAALAVTHDSLRCAHTTPPPRYPTLPLGHWVTAPCCGWCTFAVTFANVCCTFTTRNVSCGWTVTGSRTAHTRARGLHAAARALPLPVSLRALLLRFVASLHTWLATVVTAHTLQRAHLQRYVLPTRLPAG